MTDTAPTVVWHVTMSLDGYIAGRDHAMASLLDRTDSAPSPLGRSVMAKTGAILAGRNWYDAATAHYDGRRGIYGGDWDGPVFVVTHRPEPAPGDPGITFVPDLDAGIASARTAAGNADVGVFGASVAQQCLQAGLLDEIVVHVAPVLLGDGVRLYGDGLPRVPLRRVELEPGDQVAGLRFEV